MIVPEIRHFVSADIDDLENHRPADPERFSFVLDLLVGPTGGEGEEQFELVVSTPTWLAERYGPDEVVSGRHRLIVFSYDWVRIESFLRKAVSRCDADDWKGVAEKVGRFARWEFEDYEF